MEKAAKELRTTGLVVEVDRDTKGVGGTPNIAETILAKIRVCDVFVWDATLVCREPRPAPNPNVVFELGYAVGVLGWNRMIGVINTANRGEAKRLPFDLRHRRWPISYSLSTREGAAKKAQAKNGLTAALRGAIEDALAEPKDAALLADTDHEATRRLWAVLKSEQVQGWKDVRVNSPNREDTATMETFRTYIASAGLPENRLRAEPLAAAHSEFVRALVRYSGCVSKLMVPLRGAPDCLVNIAKANSDEGLVQDYEKNDEQYEMETTAIEAAAREVWAVWGRYASALAERYPDVVGVR